MSVVSNDFLTLCLLHVSVSHGFLALCGLHVSVRHGFLALCGLHFSVSHGFLVVIDAVDVFAEDYLPVDMVDVVVN